MERSHTMRPMYAAVLLAFAALGGCASSFPRLVSETQVADLADVAQRIDLSLRALVEEAGDAAPTWAEGLDALTGEVGRLVQFTRTLGYLAAPPARGEQVFSLSTLLEELLKSVARAGPDAPRYLYRGPGELEVRSDKRLLVQAFDALLQLAGGCAASGEVVRVAAREAAGELEGSQEVEVEITFPAGPLRDLEPGELLRPYALRRRLPGIGPNAIAAAAGILRGQGGGLALGPAGDGELRCVARLPGQRDAPRRNGSG